jgi:hypothetical protein
MNKDFEFDDKTRNILNNKMALALIRMLYVKDLISSKEYNKILKISKSEL